MPVPVHLDKVVEGLAGNPALPPEPVSRLFAYRGGFGSVAKGPDLTEEMIAEIIAADDDWLMRSLDSPYACFRASAAQSGRLPGPVVTRLLNDEESSVRTTMALHARDRIDPATAERIDRGYRPGKKTRWRPADEFPLPAAVLRRLATDNDPRMRQLAPRDPGLPTELVRRLAGDPDQMARRAIATHPLLPTPDLTQLLADSSESVATAAAGNPALPPRHMHRILALAGL
jgi:hypothetical protein